MYISLGDLKAKSLVESVRVISSMGSGGMVGLVGFCGGLVRIKVHWGGQLNS